MASGFQNCPIMPKLATMPSSALKFLPGTFFTSLSNWCLFGRLLDPQVDEFQCKNGSCVPLENKYVGSPQFVHDKVMMMPCFWLSKGFSPDDYWQVWWNSRLWRNPGEKAEKNYVHLFTKSKRLMLAIGTWRSLLSTGASRRLSCKICSKYWYRVKGFLTIFQSFKFKTTLGQFKTTLGQLWEYVEATWRQP